MPENATLRSIEVSLVEKLASIDADLEESRKMVAELEETQGRLRAALAALRGENPLEQAGLEIKGSLAGTVIGVDDPRHPVQEKLREGPGHAQAEREEAEEPEEHIEIEVKRKLDPVSQESLEHSRARAPTRGKSETGKAVRALSDEEVRDWIVDVGRKIPGGFAGARMAEHFDISGSTARRELQKWVKKGVLRETGTGRGKKLHYVEPKSPGPGAQVSAARNEPPPSPPPDRPQQSGDHRERPSSGGVGDLSVWRDYAPYVQKMREQGWRLEGRERHVLAFPPNGERAVPIGRGRPSSSNTINLFKQTLRKAGLKGV